MYWIGLRGYLGHEKIIAQSLYHDIAVTLEIDQYASHHRPC